MSDADNSIVEHYLDQVKIITALATTLMITPNVYLTLLEKDQIRTRIEATLPCWRSILLTTNILFLLSIILTYFIYSSIVGSSLTTAAAKDIIYRPFTRFVSITQFVFLVLGCVGLLIIFSTSN